MQVLSQARAQLVQTSEFDPNHTLPGTQWCDELKVDDTMDLDLDLDLDPDTDITGDLELT